MSAKRLPEGCIQGWSGSPEVADRRPPAAGLKRAPEVCTCIAARQLARQLTQLYDQCLAPSGLRVGQFSILAKLDAFGSQTVAQLAERLVLDRKSLGLALRPLERDGMVRLAIPDADRRRRQIELTPEGRTRLAAAIPHWRRAQRAFDDAYGRDATKGLRKLFRQIIEAMEDAGLTGAHSAPDGGPGPEARE